MGAEGDAEVGVFFKDGDGMALLRRMEINDLILIAEVHRQHIGYPLFIGHSHVAQGTGSNQPLHTFLFLHGICLHTKIF
jgi:hypothetical protein